MSYGQSKKVIPSPGGILPNRTIYEQIKVGETVQYAVKTEKGVDVEPFLSLGENVVYQPLAPSPWMLPPKPEPYDSLRQLWDRLRRFIWEHLDLGEEALYDVFVAWAIATWVPEQWDSVPYLHFHGPSNSGKTRALDILNHVAYRPLLSSSASGPALFRALDAFHPTFLLDEFEMYEKQKETQAEVLGILNAGYRRGQFVFRIVGMKEGTPMLRGFDTFGPKALSSILELPSTLNGRSVRFPMSRAVRRVKRLIDKEESQRLRGMLLQYRFAHVFDTPPKGNPIDLPDGRLIELYLPLITVAPPEVEMILLKHAREQYAESIETERETEDAVVFDAIVDLLLESPRLRLLQTDILGRVNAQRSESEVFSKTKLGYVLRRFGFRKETDRATKLKQIVVDADILDRRKIRYVLPEEMEAVDALVKELRRLASTPPLTLSALSSFSGEDSVSPPKGVSSNIMDINHVPQTLSSLSFLSSVSSGGGPPLGVGKDSEDRKDRKDRKDTEDRKDSVDSADTADIASLRPVPLRMPSLRAKLEVVLGMVIARSTVNDGARRDDIMRELNEKHGIPEPEGAKLLDILLRDGTIFSPRSETYRKS